MENLLIFKALLALLAAFFIGYLPVYFLFEYKKDCLKGNKNNIDNGVNTGHSIINPLQPNGAAVLSGFYRKDGFNGRHNISKQIFIFFISIYFGFFIISNYLILLSLLKVKFSFLNAAVFSLIFFTAFIFIQLLKFYKGNHGETKRVQKEKTGKLFLTFEAFFGFLIFINFCVVIFFTFLFPIRFWDAISCWSLKGRAFFLDGSAAVFYTSHQYTFTHPTYPLYTSLSQTWIYIWLGEINETLVKVIFPLFYLSLIFIVYYLFRKKVKRLYAIISVFILSTLPVMMDHGYLEYTNLIFSIILLLGVYFFYVYIVKSNKSHKNADRQNQNAYNQNRETQTQKSQNHSGGKRAFQNQFARDRVTKSLPGNHPAQEPDIQDQTLQPGSYRRDNNKNLIISTAFFAILASIRSEGILFLAIFLVINMAYNLGVLPGSLSFRKSHTILNTAVYIILPAALGLLLMAPWIIMQIKLNISGVSSEWVPVIKGLKNGLSSILSGSLLPGGLKNILNGAAAGGPSEISGLFNFKNASGAFLGEFLFSRFDSVRAFLGSSYGIIWIILAIMAAFNFKKLFRAFNWIFFVFLFSGFIVLFMSLGFIAEFAWSTERYMLHLFPLAYFWIIRSYLFNAASLKSLSPEK